MYWNDTTSNIDTLLTKEGITLKQILDEEDVLQECIANNNGLVSFLSQDEILVEMLSIITTEPVESSNEMERFKYANTVCEILTFDGNVFARVITQNEKYLAQLWSFVEYKESSDETDDNNPNELNPLLASFFTKVFLYIFTHDTNLIIEFLSKQEPPNDLVSVILRHIQTSAIMDFVYQSWKFLNLFDKSEDVNDATSQDKVDKFNELLLKNCFVEKLIAIFKEIDLGSKQQNVTILISDLICAGREKISTNSQTEVDGILAQFEGTDVARMLLNNMFESQTKNSIVSGLKLIQALLEYRIQVQNLITQQNEQLSSMANGDEQDVELEGMPKFLKQNNSPTGSEAKFMAPQLSSPVGVYGEHLSRCIRNVCLALHERLEDFVSLLLNHNGLEPIHSTIGVINQPLGLIRLEVIHLFVALFATSDHLILEKCASLHVLQILTNFFFEFKLNNQLHKYYEQIIEYIFQNYTNFKNIYVKHSANIQSSATVAASSGEDVTSEETTPVQPTSSNDKIDNFIKLYEVSKVLVKQILQECRLIEKILDNYANETVPTKSSSDQTQVLNIKKDLVDGQNSADNKVQLEEDKNIEIKEEKDKTDLSEAENVVKTEDVGEEETKINDESSDHKEDETKQTVNQEQNDIKSKTQRPAYMGHLRLIANILKERCTEDLLNECGLTENDEVFKQWNEFTKGKLSDLNTLINTKLVEESEIDQITSEQDIFYNYQTESMSQHIPSNMELLPCDFGQNSLGDINQQLKLMTDVETEVDFEKFWSTNNENFYNLDKYFESSSIFEEDDDEDDEQIFGSGTGGGSNGLKGSKKERPTLLAQVIHDDFATFDSKDPFVNSDDSTFDDFENFANFDNFNQTSSQSNNIVGNNDNSDSVLWPNDVVSGNSGGGGLNSNLASMDSACNLSNSNDIGWADFSTDPFGTTAPTGSTNTVGADCNDKQMQTNANSFNIGVDDDSSFSSNIVSTSSPNKADDCDQNSSVS